MTETDFEKFNKTIDGRISLEIYRRKLKDAGFYVVSDKELLDFLDEHSAQRREIVALYFNLNNLLCAITISLGTVFSATAIINNDLIKQFVGIFMGTFAIYVALINFKFRKRGEK